MSNKIVAVRAYVISNFEISIPESLRLMVSVMESFNRSFLDKDGWYARLRSQREVLPKLQEVERCKPVIRQMLKEFINSGGNNLNPHVRYLNDKLEILVQFFTNIELTKYYREKFPKEGSPHQQDVDVYEPITRYLEQSRDAGVKDLIFSYYFIFAFQFYVEYCCQYQQPCPVNFTRSVNIILNPRKTDLEGMVVISSFSETLNYLSGLSSQSIYLRAVSQYLIMSAVEGSNIPLPILLQMITNSCFWERYFNISTFADTDKLFQGYIGDGRIETKHQDAVPYAPTGYDEIGVVFGYLLVTGNDVFVDLGCGKGRVCNVVASIGAKKVIGVDCNPELIEVARDNSLRNTRKRTEIELVTVDAANYVPVDGTIFFMFNSFGEKTLRDVLRNIKNSLRDNPRRVRIVYFFPAYKSVIDEEDWLELKKYPGGIYIWESRLG